MSDIARKEDSPGGVVTQLQDEESSPAVKSEVVGTDESVDSDSSLQNYDSLAEDEEEYATDEDPEEYVLQDDEWDSDSTTNTSNEASDIEEYATTDSESDDDKRVLNVIMVGEAIVDVLGFVNQDSEYDEDEGDMFDAHLSESCSSSESDLSDPSGSEEDIPERSASQDKSDVGDDCVEYSDDSDLQDGMDIDDDTALDLQEDMDVDEDELMDMGVTELEGFQRDDIKLRLEGKDREEKACEVLELEEAIRQMQEELRVAKVLVKEADRSIRKADRVLLINLDKAGLSRELFAEFKYFCESLQPEDGLREGFSITCTESHDGSYVLYDPDFKLFKRHVEVDYAVCNWRCEASVIKLPWSSESQYVVEFWPLKPPKNFNGDNNTWGRLYPNLYRTLKDSARNGSAAAKEMLQRLPDRRAEFTGGWLFDYQFEELLKDEPIISRRWTLRGSHDLR